MLHCEELKDEEGPSNTLQQFTDLENVLQAIDSLKACDAPGFEKDYEHYTETLSRYQEQPHLLDPHLELLLDKLLLKIRNSQLSEAEIHAAFKYLYIICKVRTYKVLVKFLPHELKDLEFALELLERQNPHEFKNWETRYMLLLWMSILVLNPFHMSRLDAYAVDATNAAGSELPSKTKMERIYELCKIYCSTNDTCSSIAAFLAAKYFVRADIKDIYLQKFLEWIMTQHNAETVDVKYGQLAAVAAILKHGKREDLLPFTDKLLQWIISCQYKDSMNFLKYKNYIKIIQRIGLVYLKPRLASWRYKRGTRSLASNLNKASVCDALKSSNNVCDLEDATDDFDIPDAIEEVIEELLQALRSAGSDIRWSAAKGIGRVTNRLTKELADEVIGSIIEILNPLEPHEAWHGACLALAELGKRGLLLPQRLQELVPLLSQALFYDEMKGYMSVGQHIRDSACYMCWAFARAYNPEDFKPFVHDVSAGLLTVAVFDREINCRRAASAAFQESVGRLGNFPHGIEISTMTDFYSVGLRSNSYLHISDFIAQFEEYRQPLIDHLLQKKVNHWDSAIREITAKALHKLTFRASEYMVNQVLPRLLTNTESIDINTRHGSVLALGEIVLALRLLEQSSVGSTNHLSKALINDLNGLLKKFLERDLFRGISGEMMKQCCSDFIRNCCLAKLEADAKAFASWQQIIDKCILNKNAPIRESATAAFAELCRTYYSISERKNENDQIISGYLQGADSANEEHIRMGYISALGVLPRSMLIAHVTVVLDHLIKHALPPYALDANNKKIVDGNAPTHKWSEARRDSVKSLIKFVHTIGFQPEPPTFSNANNFNKVINCLLDAIDEYTLDNRGDIGAWVREAAMNAIYELITSCPKHLLQPLQVHQIMLAFMQQSVEKIDRTRGLAGRLCCNLINADPTIPHIQEHERLKSIFPTDANTVLWLFADHTFPLFCSLLDMPIYSKRILLGLSASIGQLTESLIKYSSNAFFAVLRSHPEEVPRLCKEIVQIFEENLLNERVTYPMLNFLDILIASGTINAVLVNENDIFSDDIYRLLNLEIKGHKKLYKLASSINVYCQLVQVPRLCRKILSKMAIFLGLTHVHVRKTAASKLYEALALHGDMCDIPEENMDEILNLLTETDWGLPLVEVRPIRNELCTLMGIKAPVSGIMAANANVIVGRALN